MRGPLQLLLDLFSSVRFGIVLLTLLFIYSSIGSAGMFWFTGGNPLDTANWIHVQLRQNRGLEMTEFEWFHWWPFDLMIGLICANIVVTTLRRIRLSKINAGVWMIHSGILVLCAGSLIYFSAKVEGDTPVVRRQVAVQLPTGERTVLPAVPGSQRTVRTVEGPWRLRVFECNPEWVLASEGDAGRTAFSTMVEVDGPRGAFWRQLIDGHPQYTEDMVRSDDPRQPMQRFVKQSGRPLVLQDVTMTLEPAVSEWFYLAHWVQKSWALYLREKTPDDRNEWIQRPASDIPLYNDYIASLDDVWMPPGRTLPIDPIDVPVPSVDDRDPLSGIPLHVTAYLRYAEMEKRLVASGEGQLNPTCSIRLSDGMGENFEYEMRAFDPVRSVADGGFVAFRWAASEDEREALGRTPEPLLRLHVHDDGEGGHDAMLELPVREFSLRNPDLEWTPVGDTGYSVRVEFLENRLQLEPGQFVSMVSLEVRSPTREFRRWVFDDPRLDRDFTPAGDGHGIVPESPLETDHDLHVSFDPGPRLAPVTIIGGPEHDRLSVLMSFVPGRPGEEYAASVGEAVSLGGGNTLTITNLVTNSAEVRKPAVVPPEQRIRNVTTEASMVRVAFSYAGQEVSEWVRFQRFPLMSQADNLRRNTYAPTEVELADGRILQIVLSRQRLPLPHPVRLDDFELTEHVGGFTGSVQSIRNWTSRVRFEEPDGLTEPVSLSVNAPVENNGLWFFQAEWDPPSGRRFQGDVASAGLNYTVLGVGNRQGVMIQLIGCCIAVIGMIYAFYYKPILLARLRGRVRSRSTDPGPDASGVRGAALPSQWNPPASHVDEGALEGRS